ncbi:hypothetical protein [uncultured Zhongshania sp.]|uniref:hypothetical protein n=1 Tax=uncultured Zhongshania sp. TaxID=1642288 RepID=UPI0030D87309
MPTKPLVLPRQTDRHRQSRFGDMRELRQHLKSKRKSQTYTGDIDILPQRQHHGTISLLSARSTDGFWDRNRDREYAYWPYIKRIRLQTSIRHALDRILLGMPLSLRADSQESKPDIAVEAH